MRHLTLVRHAKSSWDDPELPDRERPLAPRGERDAPKMAKRLAARTVAPDLIVSSPAKRALATARLFADALDYARKRIVVDDRLYATDAETLLSVAQGLPDDARRVLLFGHNPELTEFANRLGGKVGDLPTCAVLELGYDIAAWSALGRATPKTVALDYPKKDKADQA